MYQQHNSTGYAPNPTANLTVNRNRVKDYDEKFYLKDGTHFELELFNPLTERLLVQILLNGENISEKGIILNPGERVYLERWLDSPRKFKFSTYHVENTPEAKRAISKNGKVEIRFFCEMNKSFFPWNPTPYWYTHDGTLPVTCSTSISYNSAHTTITTNTLFSDNANQVSSANQSSIVTGRAGHGEESKQEFTSTYGEFSSYPLKTFEWQILPESEKPVEISKIRSYCTECGVRVRSSSWKFCPSCGLKL